jgi:CubicO group peptidase (beta-lactamase class C family)
MKVKFIVIQVLLVLVFFFGEIGISFSGRESNGRSADNESNAVALAINNDITTFEGSDNLDQVVEKFRKKYNIKGISVAVTKGGRLVYARGFGHADIDLGEQTEPWHVYRLASVSKLVTAIAVMKLYEDGKLDLDEKVFGPDGILNDSEYLNYRDERVEDITIRHLLTHTAGWSRRNGDPMFMPHQVARKTKTQLPVEVESIIEFELTRKLNYRPGTKYSYSNLGYAILGEIIEVRSGIAYEDYVNLAILNPIGVYNMQLGRSFEDEKADREVSYYEAYKTRKVLSYRNNKEFVDRTYGGTDVYTLGAAGGWIGSPIEVMKLITAIDGRDSSPDIIAPETIALMTNRGKSGREMFGWKGSDGYGTWWRTGTLTGNAALVVRQNNDINWIILLNTSTTKRSRIHSEMSRTMFHAVAKINKWPEYDLFDYQDPIWEYTELLTQLQDQ